MSARMRGRLRGFLAAAALTLGVASPAAADEISVTHWGALMYGTPYAVALDQGFFKKSGIEITGILTSKGGGTTVRNVLQGGLPFGEVALSAAIAAIREGMDIKIVNAGVLSVADALWVVMPNSDVKTVKDLIGKKMAITSPKSVTDMMTTMILHKLGIGLDQIQRPALGGIGSALTALEKGGVQAAPIFDPIWSARKDRYRVLFYVKDILPPIMQSVGITTSEFIKKEPKKLAAIVRGRMMGVDYIYAHPKETGTILAKAYGNLKPEVAQLAVSNMVKIKYWGRGDFDIAAMNEMVRGLKLIGELKEDVDWDKVIDRSFLPKELQK
ncbi:MAG: ABC transporter substrate-binding protein [Rhodospirillaceae bacterium]|nr:ABC transporter substrate-binding protein [Rhodospirillaceae bacterium]